MFITLTVKLSKKTGSVAINTHDNEETVVNSDHIIKIRRSEGKDLSLVHLSTGETLGVTEEVYLIKSKLNSN